MLSPVHAVIEIARFEFAALLRRARLAAPLSTQQYQRYLSMQYHLTRGVQTYFMRAAAHKDMARRKALRKFLCAFANEEEQHYLVAANDLAKMGLEILPEPVDVTLWHAYFGQIVDQHPFVRLGAACILENIAGGSAKDEIQAALRAPFLRVDNTKFLVLHQHETLPHGEQMLAALEAAHLEPMHVAELEAGAKLGAVMYLRMAEWALFPGCLTALADPIRRHECSIEERADIDQLDMRHVMAAAG